MVFSCDNGRLYALKTQHKGFRKHIVFVRKPKIDSLTCLITSFAIQKISFLVNILVLVSRIREKL